MAGQMIVVDPYRLTEEIIFTDETIKPLKKFLLQTVDYYLTKTDARKWSESSVEKIKEINLKNYIRNKDFIEELLVLSYENIACDVVDGTPVDIRKYHGVIYVKKVTMEENALLHLNSWAAAYGEVERITSSATLIFRKKLDDKAGKFYWYIPLIHKRTLIYLTTVKFTQPNKRFYTLVGTFTNIVTERYRHRTMIFGSVAASLYGIYGEGTNRPRDLDFWYDDLLYESINGSINNLPEDSKRLFDAYGISSSFEDRKNIKQSMTQRLFGFFQMAANAGVETEYRKLIAPFPSSVKTQINNDAGTGPFFIITMEDILYSTNNSVFAYGCNFLTIELEVFRKHLRYIDKCNFTQDGDKIENICKNTKVIPKDIHDFEIIRKRIIDGKIRPPTPFNVDTYLKYLGINDNLDLPIHSYGIYTSVSNEKSYEILDSGGSVVNISNPRRNNMNNLRIFSQLAFPSSIIGDIVFKTNYRKTTIGLAPHLLDTYTRRNDAISGLVYTHQKVFRNVSLKSVPKTPIKSIYGDLPSCWLWVLTSKGSLDIMLVTSGFELLNKHLTLSYGTSHLIASGEMRVQSNGDIVFNLQSGTYTPFHLEKVSRYDNDKRWINSIKSYFALNLERSWFNDHNLYYIDNVLIPKNKRPYTDELSMMCSGFTLKDRILKHDPQIKHAIVSQEDFNFISKRGKLACEDPVYLLKYFESVRFSLGDINTEKYGKISYNLPQMYSDVYIASPSISVYLNLPEYLEKRYHNSILCNFVLSSAIKKCPSHNRSASPSVVKLGVLEFKSIGIGEDVNIPYINYVAAKYSFARDIGLGYEVKVYRYLFEKLIKTHSTPHISSYIYGVVNKECSPVVGSLLNCGFIEDKNEKINLIISEWLGGDSISNLLEKGERLSLDSIIYIMFQIVWTLYCLHKIDAQHNDLHPGNVYLSLLKNPTKLTYFYRKDISIQIMTNIFIKIYDFDQSYVSELGPNPYLENDSFKNSGIFNAINERFDVHLFWCAFSYLLRSKGMTDQADKISRKIYGNEYESRLNPQQWAFHCRICNMDKFTGKCNHNNRNYDAPTLHDWIGGLGALSDGKIKHKSTGDLSPDCYPDNATDSKVFFGRDDVPIGRGKFYKSPSVNIESLTVELTRLLPESMEI